jgi:hypothetical protein
MKVRDINNILNMTWCKYAILSAVIIMGIIASETMIVIAQEQIRERSNNYC